jgi:hypothetical protein
MWVIRCAAMYGNLADPATAGSRIFLTSHVNLEGIEALEEDWRTVTGAELPSAIRNHFAAHGDAARADEFLAGLQDKLGHATSAQDLREITRDDLRRAVLDYRDSAAGEPLPL